VRLPLLLAALALAGCGAGGPQTPKQLFGAACGPCHTLADAGTSGQIGPNLDDLAPDRARVLDAIRSGPGRMPADRLAGPKAQAVAAYVASVASGG
jgi:mono/diheme cytochrome c family protein